VFAHRVGPCVGEDEVHTRENAVVVVNLERPSQRVGGAECRDDQPASRVVEEVSRIIGRVLGRRPR
jgi:hypothetical protein